MKPNILFLKETDICALATKDGKLIGTWAHDEPTCYEHADYISEFMIKVMKNPEHSKGLWLWTFENDFNTLTGRLLKTDD